MAALLAAWLACAASSGSVTAAAESPMAATGVHQPRHYDPFDEVRDPFDELAPAAVAEKRTPTASTANQRQNYDPFEALSPAAAAGTTTAGSTTCVFQQSAPTLSEPLPMPPDADQPADGAAAAANWSPKPLGELTTNIVLPSGLLPRDYWAARPPQAVAFFDPCGATRGWPVNSFCWEASSFCHNPLYFEEINLERYGYGCCACLQPAASACHFFATVPALPYKMAVATRHPADILGAGCPPCECDYTLGHYRPGSCPPRRYHCCSRVSCLAGLSEAGVVTGMIFLIP